MVAQERSLLLRFPDYRQHKLFPESATEFFHVAFQQSGFVVAYEAKFGLDEDRRVQYLELVFGAEPLRMNRLGPQSVVPAVPTLKAATTAPPTTATRSPTASAPTATPLAVAQVSPSAPAVATASTSEPAEEGGGVGLGCSRCWC